MPKNNNLSIEDCKEYFATTKKYERKEELNQRYLIELFDAKDFIIEALTYQLTVKMLYEYLSYKQAVSMTYSTFIRLIKSKILKSQKISDWKFEQNAGKLEQISQQLKPKTQSQQTNDNCKTGINAPSFSDWDGDSTKFIDDLV